MAVLTQTVTTETAINWEELAQKIKDNTSGLKVGDIITEKEIDDLKGWRKNDKIRAR